MRNLMFEFLRTFHGAGAVGEKHVFGSDARLSGKGCQTLAFVCWTSSLFFSCSNAAYFPLSFC